MGSAKQSQRPAFLREPNVSSLQPGLPATLRDKVGKSAFYPNKSLPFRCFVKELCAAIIIMTCYTRLVKMHHILNQDIIMA